MKLGAFPGAGSHGAEQYAALDERAGLASVHVFDGLDRQRLADGREVDSLSTGHTARSGGPGKRTNHRKSNGG